MAKKIRDPSMPLYVADWLSSQSIAMMNADEERGFMRLLMHAWLSGDCTLPDDDEALSRLSLLGDKWHAGSGQILRRSFKQKRGSSGAKIYNVKLTELWKERRDFVEHCRKAGIKSGQARRSGANHGSTDVATVAPTKRQPKSNSSSSSSSTSSSSKSIIDVWLAKVKAETLASTGLLLDWFHGAAAAGAVDGSDFIRDSVVALAIRCRVRGRNGGGGLFTTLMRAGDFSHANSEDFAAAVAAVKEHMNAQDGPPNAEIEAMIRSALKSMPKE